MPRLESSLETWACAWARFRGIVVAKLAQCNGIPDRIFFVPGGVPVIVEFKRVGKRGKQLQEATQPWYADWLARAGYRVYTCDTKEQFREIMASWSKQQVSNDFVPKPPVPKSSKALKCNCWVGRGHAVRMTVALLQQKAACPVHGGRRPTR